MTICYALLNGNKWSRISKDFDFSFDDLEQITIKFLPLMNQDK